MVEMQRWVLEERFSDLASLELVAGTSARIVVLCSWWAGKPTFSAEHDARRDLPFVLNYAEILLGVASLGSEEAASTTSCVRDAVLLLRTALRLEPSTEERAYLLFERRAAFMWYRDKPLPFDVVAIAGPSPSAVLGARG